MGLPERLDLQMEIQGIVLTLGDILKENQLTEDQREAIEDIRDRAIGFEESLD
jgi:hypothetical protein